MMVTYVEFMNMDASDTLILCCGSHGYSCMEIWQLVGFLLFAWTKALNLFL
jgi:hypothetical protein